VSVRRESNGDGVAVRAERANCEARYALRVGICILGGTIACAVKTRTHFRRHFARATLTISVAVSALTLRARADSLEHGFVEPCTLANVQEPELECEACASAFGSRVCQERLEPRGFVKKCRTHGTHAGWDELWCARKTAAAKNGARESSLGTTGLVLGAAATLAAAVLAMRVLTKPAR
jgi:hypothetical protein